MLKKLWIFACEFSCAFGKAKTATVLTRQGRHKEAQAVMAMPCDCRCS